MRNAWGWDKAVGFGLLGLLAWHLERHNAEIEARLNELSSLPQDVVELKDRATSAELRLNALEAWLEALGEVWGD